MYKIFLRARL